MGAEKKITLSRMGHKIFPYVWGRAWTFLPSSNILPRAVIVNNSLRDGPLLWRRAWVILGENFTLNNKRLKSNIPAIQWGPENLGSSKTQTTTQAAVARAHTQSTLEDIPIGQPIIFMDGSALGNPDPCGLQQSASRSASSILYIYIYPNSIVFFTKTALL